MHYLFVDGEVERVTIDVAEIMEGETGTFPATLEIDHVDGRSWTAAECTVDVDEHVAEPEEDDDLSRGFIVHATGSCSAAAQPDDMGNEALEIMSFELRFPPRWP